MPTAILLTAATAWPTGVYLVVLVWQRYAPVTAARRTRRGPDWTVEIEEWLSHR